MEKIYRCGWCGQPTDADGNILSEEIYSKFSQEQMDAAIQVNGVCCPYGNNEYRSRAIVSKEMASDAGIPEMEGMEIDW